MSQQGSGLVLRQCFLSRPTGQACACDRRAGARDRRPGTRATNAPRANERSRVGATEEFRRNRLHSVLCLDREISVATGKSLSRQTSQGFLSR